MNVQSERQTQILSTSILWRYDVPECWLYFDNLIAFEQIKTFSRLQWLSFCFPDPNLFYIPQLTSQFCPTLLLSHYWVNSTLIWYENGELQHQKSDYSNQRHWMQSDKISADLSKTELPTFFAINHNKCEENSCNMGVCNQCAVEWQSKQQKRQAVMQSLHGQRQRVHWFTLQLLKTMSISLFHYCCKRVYAQNHCDKHKLNCPWCKHERDL